MVLSFVSTLGLLAGVEAATLAVTWEDCGATHGKFTDLQPASIETGGTSTVVGTGVIDEDVTAGQFNAVIKALGVKIASCSGDASSDIVCKLPAGVGEISVKAILPLSAGTISVPVDVKTSSIIPASLAKVDAHIEATEQAGESALCLDIHTEQQDEAEVTGTLAVTWEDCGATHGKFTGLSPSSIETGSTETVVGTGVIDEDVTAGKFTAVISALGVKITTCSGDASSDIVCKLPAGVGEITVKALLPLSAGTISVPVQVKTSSVIPASLAKVDVHVEATEQSGESALCLDIHTAPQDITV